MLKHILTTNCPRSCEYCITRNVKADTCTDLNAIKTKYEELYAQGHKDIMLTGGEPVISPIMGNSLMMAKRIFDSVHITTQDKQFIRKHCILNTVFDSIMYSLHDGLMDECVTINTTVYGSILDRQYTPELPHKLKARGFSGLTINEEQREGKSFDVDLPEIDGFSIRINRIGHCMDETIILPNLQVITDFREYL